jgi:hypothetical protein
MERHIGARAGGDDRTPNPRRPIDQEESRIRIERPQTCLLLHQRNQLARVFLCGKEMRVE